MIIIPIRRYMRLSILWLILNMGWRKSCISMGLLVVPWRSIRKNLRISKILSSISKFVNMSISIILLKTLIMICLKKLLKYSKTKIIFKAKPMKRLNSTPLCIGLCLKITSVKKKLWLLKNLFNSNPKIWWHCSSFKTGKENNSFSESLGTCLLICIKGRMNSI